MVKRVFPTLKRLWSSDTGLTVLTIGLFLDIFIFSPLLSTRIGVILSDVFFMFIIIAGILTVFNSRILRIYLSLLAVVSMVVHWSARCFDSLNLLSLDVFLLFVFAALLAAMILIQVFREGPMTLHRIMGAVTVYLLIGIMWGALYNVIGLQLPGAFQLPAGLANHDPRGLEEHYLYFSFVTLTTLGYGDIVPIHPVARNLVVLEGLIGQLFPVILLSRLVSIEIMHSKRDKGPGSKDMPK
jgi:hypothetical protein